MIHPETKSNTDQFSCARFDKRQSQVKSPHEMPNSPTLLVSVLTGSQPQGVRMRHNGNNTNKRIQEFIRSAQHNIGGSCHVRTIPTISQYGGSVVTRKSIVTGRCQQGKVRYWGISNSPFPLPFPKLNSVSTGPR